MYMLGPDLLKLMPSAYTVAQELERYKMGVLKVSDRPDTQNAGLGPFMMSALHPRTTAKLSDTISKCVVPK